MARINKKEIVGEMTGLPSKGAILAAGGDDVPAVITDQQGNPTAPAAIKEGEIVFSVEAVIGAGQGDYDDGAAFLLDLHEKLKELGSGLMGEQGLGSV